jgi:hypothetical protein
MVKVFALLIAEIKLVFCQEKIYVCTSELGKEPAEKVLPNAEIKIDLNKGFWINVLLVVANEQERRFQFWVHFSGYNISLHKKIT